MIYILLKKWYLKFNMDVTWQGKEYKAGEILSINANKTKENDAKTTFEKIKVSTTISQDSEGNASGSTQGLVTIKMKIYASSINLPQNYGELEKMKNNNINSSKVDSQRKIDSGYIKRGTSEDMGLKKAA